MPKRALITGITGQDGAYLARLLLGKGYRVVGTYRPTSSLNLWRLEALGLADHPDLQLVEHDLTDLAASFGLLESAQPDELYNLAAQSFVGLSFKQPVSTAQVTAIGPLNMLEAIRMVNPAIRFYQASSSEMFGPTLGAPHDETSPLRPHSPYAVSKCFAHLATINYREAYGLYAASGILFNHESPLRSLGFVTRKITDAVARIRLGKSTSFHIGNLDAERDWGYADEYVDGIHRMLQAERPDDFILATGTAHTVREFASLSFAAAGMPIRWEGDGVQEQALDTNCGAIRVRVDPALYRPADVNRVVGNPGKANRLLEWRARIELPALCALMLEEDLTRQRIEIKKPSNY